MTKLANEALTTKLEDQVLDYAWMRGKDRLFTVAELDNEVRLFIDFLLDTANAYPSLKETLDRDELTIKVRDAYWKENSLSVELKNTK